MQRVLRTLKGEGAYLIAWVTISRMRSLGMGDSLEIAYTERRSVTASRKGVVDAMVLDLDSFEAALRAAMNLKMQSRRSQDLIDRRED